SGKQKCEHARDGLVDGEGELAKQLEANKRGQNGNKNLRQINYNYVAHGRIGVAIVIKDVQLCNVRTQNVLRQHEQRLPNAVPALQRAVAPVHTELGIFIGENRRLGSPESVR